MDNLLKLYGPGILLAATGVGAGDLITAGLAGMNLGYGILWAVILGALLKWVLNEGIARFQLATNLTILDGWNQYLGAWVRWPFLIYMLIWTYFVGGALINACGAAASNIFPLTDHMAHSKIYWGILHSLAGLVLASRGNFKFFEKVMSVLISLMFITVILTSFFMINDIGNFIQQVTSPKVEDGVWALALLGGVGGTLTILSYGYWLKQGNRSGIQGLKITRKDLAISYTLTALFSIAMIIIGHQTGQIDGPKEQFPLMIATSFENYLGSFGKYVFLFGFWAGVFSSLLGVWQSVPYIFTDFYKINFNVAILKYETSKAYKAYLWIISIIPITALWIKFEKIQIFYSVFGAFFMPLLAVSLLIINNKKNVMKNHTNHWTINFLCLVTLILFSYLAIQKLLWF